MAEWTIRARLEYDGATVFITADTPEEAVEKFKRGEWDDDDISGAGLLNWEATGKPELSE